MNEEEMMAYHRLLDNVDTILHELGHVKMAEFLRVPIITNDGNEVSLFDDLACHLCVEVDDANPISMFLIGMAGVFYPIYYLLKNYRKLKPFDRELLKHGIRILPKAFIGEILQMIYGI